MRCPKCPVPEITYILPEVSWLFFKARTKRTYLNHTGGVSNAEKRPTGPGPEGCDENGPAAALLVGHVSNQICSAPRALPTAHFDRNKMHTISGTGHQNVISLQRKIKPNGIHLTEMRSHEVLLFPVVTGPR